MSIEGAGRHINAGLAGNRYVSRFYRMAKLSMTAPLADLSPTVIFEQLDQLSNLHMGIKSSVCSHITPC